MSSNGWSFFNTTIYKQIVIFVFMENVILEGLTIFYTDDDQDDLDFFAEVVEDMGIKLNLVTQNNGHKLIDALQNPPPNPHIVFLDLNMPGINGFQILQQLRATDKFKNLPIVVFSTSNDDFIIAKSMDLGASFYVNKPSNYAILKQSIQYALNINWNTFVTTRENFLYVN